jgi:hypothetical protein
LPVDALLHYVCGPQYSLIRRPRPSRSRQISAGHVAEVWNVNTALHIPHEGSMGPSLRRVRNSILLYIPHSIYFFGGGALLIRDRVTEFSHTHQWISSS